jgi:hypothetical protein
MEIDPTFHLPHFYLGEAFQDKGDLSGAIAEYTRALQLSDTLIGRVYLAAAKTQSGNKGAAQQMLTELEELSQHYRSAASVREFFGARTFCTNASKRGSPRSGSTIGSTVTTLVVRETLLQPSNCFVVGQWYESFPQTKDQEVRQCLTEATQRQLASTNHENKAA